MSSITFTSKPNGGDVIPDWVLASLVNLEVTLCSPQSIICLGSATFKNGDILSFLDEDNFNSYCISWGGLKFSLIANKQQEVVDWFLKKHPSRLMFDKDESVVFFINKRHCKYNP